jgi:hypothetical protein
MNVSAADISNMTNQLVKAVAQRAGLTEDQSRKAIIAAFEVLKEQLPASVAGDVDTFVQGGGDLDGALQWFLNLVGKK